MKIRTVKHIVTAIICIVFSTGVYSADELHDPELSGIAYITIPFGGHYGNSSPTFGLAFGQAAADTITGSSVDINPLLNHPTRKSLFDIEYDLADRRWSRFAFGGINALVYDDVLHANGGGGPTIDPSLVILGIGAAGVIYMSVKSDDNPPKECEVRFAYTANIEDPCRPPPDECNDQTFTLNIDPCVRPD